MLVTKRDRWESTSVVILKIILVELQTSSASPHAIFAKMETLRVGNVASCSEFLYTKSVVTHNDFARWYTWKPNHLLETQNSWILTLLKILYGCVKIRHFLQENQTIYYNPSNYCRNSNVSVTGWFIYSDRHQGGNYLKWRSLFFFPSTFFLRNLFSKCST